MSDNSLIVYDIVENTVSFGGVSDEIASKLIDLTNKGFRSITDPLFFSIEAKKLNQIISFMKEKGLDLVEAVRKDDTGWTLRFTKEILDHSIIEKDNYIFDLWRKLILSFNDKDNKFREKCAEYSKIILKLSSSDAKLLKEIYICAKDSKSIYDENYDDFYSCIEKLTSLNLISSLQYNSGGSVQGVLNINPYKTVSIHKNSTVEHKNPPFYKYIQLVLNHQTKEFVNFMNQEI